jgi:hypothetical protein
MLGRIMLTRGRQIYQIMYESGWTVRTWTRLRQAVTNETVQSVCNQRIRLRIVTLTEDLQTSFSLERYLLIELYCLSAKSSLFKMIKHFARFPFCKCDLVYNVRPMLLQCVFTKQPSLWVALTWRLDLDLSFWHGLRCWVRPGRIRDGRTLILLRTNVGLVITGKTWIGIDNLHRDCVNLLAFDK